jgi:hypothetical protein
MIVYYKQESVYQTQIWYNICIDGIYVGYYTEASTGELSYRAVDSGLTEKEMTRRYPSWILIDDPELLKVLEIKIMMWELSK